MPLPAHILKPEDTETFKSLLVTANPSVSTKV
jgi:hypothetical protein